MILHDYVRLLRRGWWLALGLTVLGALAAAAWTATTPRTYYTTATVYVAISGNTTPSDLQQGNIFAVQRAVTYADLASTSAVRARAAAALGSGTTPGDLQGTVTAAARPDKSLIDVTGTGSEPGQVAARANAVASALTTEAPLLDAPGANTPVQLTVVQAAEQPTVAATPRPRNNVLIGLAAGLALGVAAVVVRDALSTRIRTTADLPRSPELATLTSIPSGRARRSRHMSAVDARLESFRNLRANLQFGSHAGGIVAVAGVTSASDAAGVARSLGGALGEIGSVVVVVDLDLRPVPMTGGRDNPAPRPGVADVLRGEHSIDDAIVQAGVDKVHEISAGTVQPSSAQQLSTPAMRQVLDNLTARFDYVILACPPLVERSESAVAAALAGSALVVVESGVTKRSEFLFALELLDGVRVTSISVAIDHVRDLDLGASHGQVPVLSKEQDGARLTTLS